MNKTIKKIDQYLKESNNVNYMENITNKLKNKLPDCPNDLLKFYTLLVLTTGKETTLENVHDAWSIWQNTINPEHRSLVPFKNLTKPVQELDELYCQAIIETANEL